MSDTNTSQLQPEEDHTADAEFYRQVFAGKPDPTAALIGASIAHANEQKAAEAALERSRTKARHRRAPWDITGSPVPDGTRLMGDQPEPPRYPRGGFSNI